MAIPKSSIKKCRKVFCLRFSGNGVHWRISLRTDSLHAAKERQRQFDLARARGEQDLFSTKTPVASPVAAYAAHMKATRTRHGYTADLGRSAQSTILSGLPSSSQASWKILGFLGTAKCE